MENKKRIVVFASGSGTNFININENIANGRVVLLISNNPKCGAIDYAKKNDIDYKVINDFRYPKDKNKEYETVLNDYEPDVILLAGFMKKIPNNIIQLYKNKIMNIHPSLLPKYGGQDYYGIKVHEAVIESKDSVTGVTIHFIDNEYDRGPIIMQAEVPVNDSDVADILSKRVLEMEYKLYLKVVELFCSNKIQIEKDKVIINE
jgi:formyltetrahydrofolate-dependent phosphoribosylglycinamide formyltransferase